MISERAQTVKGLVDEHSRLVRARKKKKPSVKVQGPNSLSNMMRQDGIRLKDIRRGAGLAPTP